MTAAKTGYRALLGLPLPRRLALASIPADFADWFDYAAVVALLVFAWGEGPFVLALFGVALSLPYVAIGPLLAVYVDRTPLGRVLVLSNLGRGLTTLALVFAGSTQLVLALVFVRSSIDSAFTPARQAAIQSSTPPELLGSANGLHQAINQTSKIAGPALGGLLLTVMPAQSVFGINAMLSLVAALSLIRLGLPPRAARTPSDFRTAMTAGAAEFRRNRLLLLALVFSAIAYFALFLYDALLALLAQDFGFDATAFGIGIAASGAGGLIGALVAGRFTSHPILSMAGSAVVSGCVTIALALAAIAGLAIPVWVYFLALAAMGGSTAFMLVPYRTIVQTQTPPDRIARVFAAGEAITTAVMLSAPFIGSLIATAYGTGAAFLSGGALVLLLGVVTAVTMGRRILP
ncbi:MAG TPA: MFS transporter [Devosia sp.]|nr:MFS transporter [Devosia sp.]